MADLRGISPCLRWLDATDARSLPLFLAPSGWTPATPEIHPAPSGSRLTTHKNPRCWTHWRSSKAAPDFAGGQPLAMANSDGGRNTGKRPHWGAAFSSHTLGRARCSSGAAPFPHGAEEAGLRGES
ncbi:hypothetical protein IE989_28760 [Klebsiella pneumoniae]|nr:hypothetical protein [Klebsiella pneumoniae]